MHLALPLTRLRLTVQANAPLQLPPYAGSMLRGAFGHALLALAPLPHHGGQPCALHASCPYCQVFAPPAPANHSLQKFSHIPAPYVIEPPIGGAKQLQAGQSFRFGMVLIGKAQQHLPTILQAWQHALRTGLGSRRTPCTLIHTQEQQGVGQAQPLGQQASLHFHTPLRLQVNSKPAKAAQLTARDLLIGLARRWQLLLDTQLAPASAPQQNFDQLHQLAQGIRLDAQALHWLDWGRFSQHQQREMKLGGLIGSLHLHGELAPFADLLHLGQWLHIGKNASFGLGGYRLA